MPMAPPTPGGPNPPCAHCTPAPRTSGPAPRLPAGVRCVPRPPSHGHHRQLEKPVLQVCPEGVLCSKGQWGAAGSSPVSPPAQALAAGKGRNRLVRPQAWGRNCSCPPPTPHRGQQHPPLLHTPKAPAQSWTQARSKAGAQQPASLHPHHRVGISASAAPLPFSNSEKHPLLLIGWGYRGSSEGSAWEHPTPQSQGRGAPSPCPAGLG